MRAPRPCASRHASPTSSRLSCAPSSRALKRAAPRYTASAPLASAALTASIEPAGARSSGTLREDIPRKLVVDRDSWGSCHDARFTIHNSRSIGLFVRIVASRASVTRAEKTKNERDREKRDAGESNRRVIGALTVGPDDQAHDEESELEGGPSPQAHSFGERMYDGP